MCGADLAAADDNVIDFRVAAVLQAFSSHTQIIVEGQLHHSAAVGCEGHHVAVVRRPPGEVLVRGVHRSACAHMLPL